MGKPLVAAHLRKLHSTTFLVDTIDTHLWLATVVSYIQIVQLKQNGLSDRVCPIKSALSNAYTNRSRSILDI